MKFNTKTITLKKYKLSTFLKEFGSRANTGRVTFEGNSNKQEMYGGASSRPMAWSGGGSTQVSKLKIEVRSFIQDYILPNNI